MPPLISILIALLVFVVIIAIAFWIMGQLGVQPQAQRIIVGIMALIGLLLLLAYLFPGLVPLR